jgi:hypothetical protein
MGNKPSNSIQYIHNTSVKQTLLICTTHDLELTRAGLWPVSA